MANTYNDVSNSLKGVKKTKVAAASVANRIDGSKWKDPASWPKTLHEFIDRSFRMSKKMNLNESQTAQFKTQLKNIINLAVTSDKIMENDWTKQTLPLFDSSSHSKLELYCDTLSLDKSSNVSKRKNVFGDDESDSENEDGDYSPTITKTKPKKSISLGESLKRLKKMKKVPEPVVQAPPPSLQSSLTPRALTDAQRKQLRSKRFERELSLPVESSKSNGETISTDPIIGKNQTLEKKYLRLTSQPDPESVRPLPVLRKTLQLLFDKKFEGASYNYLCDQCKSLRQDLTVQNIRNDFTVMAYEFHSKLAIENGDWGEFNQCQSQLKLLYNEKAIKKPNYLEFLAYRVLYHILTENSNEVFELELSLMNQGYLTLPTGMLKDAIDIFQYIKNSDYLKLSKKIQAIFDQNAFDENNVPSTKQLLIKSPNALLLKHNKLYYFAKFLEFIVDRENIRTLGIICKGYRQISLQYLQEILCKKNDKDGFELFLKKNYLNSYITETGVGFNCHAARPTIESLMNKTFKKIDIKGQI